MFRLENINAIGLVVSVADDDDWGSSIAILIVSIIQSISWSRYMLLKELWNIFPCNNLIIHLSQPVSYSYYDQRSL